MCDAVTGEEEGVQAGYEGDVGERRDVVVGKVEGVVVLELLDGFLSGDRARIPLRRRDSQWKGSCARVGRARAL